MDILKQEYPRSIAPDWPVTGARRTTRRFSLLRAAMHRLARTMDGDPDQVDVVRDVEEHIRRVREEADRAGRFWY